MWHVALLRDMCQPMQKIMQAMQIVDPGPEGMLEYREIPVPLPREDELLIEVSHAGVNRADLFQKQGTYRAPAGDSPLPGLEISGKVAALGKSVSGWQLGNELCALVNGGGYAQYCVAPAGQCLPIPDELSLTQAAALPEACFTVWMALFMEADLQKGESLLVHGGASGIGVTAIQMAKAFGATVYVTAGTADKCKACEELGADMAMHYREEDFVAKIEEVTGGRGVDVVLDMVGGDYFQKNFSAVALDGRIVNIAFLRGAKEALNIAPLLLKRINWKGTTLRSRNAEYKASIAADLKQYVWPEIVSGSIKSVIDREFSLKEAEKAHEFMQQNLNIGKILLLV